MTAHVSSMPVGARRWSGTTRLLAAGIALLTGVLLAVGGLVAPTARADSPMNLRGQVTDTAGALGSQSAQVKAAIDKLYADQGTQLWVVYVPTFDGMSGQDWTDATAQASGFGGNDMLFAVATQDRSYGYSVPNDLPVSDSQLETIMADQVEPHLVAGDWPGASIALAQALGQPQASGPAGTGSAGGSSGGSFLPWLLGLLLIGGLIVLVLFLVRSGRKRAASGGTPPGGVDLATLHQQAAAALIEVDDSIKTSEQELGFAIAQFGEAEAEPFRKALAASKTDLSQAFALQAKLPDTSDPAAQRQLLDTILTTCRAADARLDEQVAHFDELRAMDRNIETILADLAKRCAALDSRIPAALTVAESLKGSFPAAAIGAVAENLQQASDRVRFAVGTVTTGQSMVASGDRPGGVAHARAAEEAIGQAEQLLAAVERAPADLAAAQAAVSALVAETGKDIAEAERLGAGPALAPTLDHARQTLAWVQNVTASGNYDPIATKRALEDSDNALEQALGPARDEAAAVQRARDLLASATDAARASIQAAEDFITTRRGAVGADARTRLSEAQRIFSDATMGGQQDSRVTLAAVQRSDQLADQALELARRDEQNYRASQQPQGGGGGGMGGLGNIVLGGILIDAMTRGGTGGGYRGPSGGAPMNFPAPSGSGSRGPGSFGGGSTRGRRGGGGRF